MPPIRVIEEQPWARDCPVREDLDQSSLRQKLTHAILLKVIGNAEPGSLDHRNVIRAIAHRETVFNAPPTLREFAKQRVALGLRVDDRRFNAAIKRTIGEAEPVGDHTVKTDHLGNRLREMREATRNQHRLPAIGMDRGDQLDRTGHDAHAFD